MAFRGKDVAVKTFLCEVFTPKLLKMLKQEISAMKSIDSEYNLLLTFSICVFYFCYI